MDVTEVAGRTLVLGRYRLGQRLGSGGLRNRLRRATTSDSTGSSRSR